MKPHAVMNVRPDKFATVCGWCEDKDSADEWCESRGYDVSHGICKNCTDKLKQPTKRKTCEQVK